MSPSLGALCCLQAWEQRTGLPGGVAFEPLLRRIALDHSPASLARIDTFLDALRTAKKPRREAFLSDPAARNLLDLLAFYAGDVVGRAVRCAPEWLWQESAEPAPPGDAGRFDNSLVCNFPGARVGLFAPLAPICARLFDASVQHGVAASARALLPVDLRPSRAPLPPAPGFGYPLDLQEAIARCSPQERAALAFEPPPLARNDRLAPVLAAAPGVLARGRVAWAGVVQAEETLSHRQADGGGRGEVVYDPAGQAPAVVLDEVAQVLSELKARPVDEPSLPAFSAWLAGAEPPISGLDVPTVISPYPLKVTATWFPRSHLPGGVLAFRSCPVVIADAHPGVVLLLPALLWPPVLLQAWGAGEPETGS